MELNGRKDNIKRIKLDTLEDIKALIIDIIQECGDAGLMVEKSSSINGFLQTWLKCHEIEKNETEIIERLEKLEEKERKREKNGRI